MSGTAPVYSAADFQAEFLALLPTGPMWPRDSDDAEFLAMETAVGDYVLALDLIITTGTGTLPSASVTIA